MSGDIGDISAAVGEVGLGAAAAKAVEPSADGAGSGNAGHDAGKACLNCGATLFGAHCHACGQKAKIHRTLRAFMHDLIHGVLHFDGKFWRTIPLLFWRPGTLIREYIEGQRAKHISPIALFLFTVFVSFALFSAVGGFGDIEPEITPATAKELQASLDNADSTIARLNNRLVEEELTNTQKAGLRAEIEEATAQRTMLSTLLETAEITDDPGGVVKVNSTGSGSDPPEPADPKDQATTDAVANWIEGAVEKAKSNPGLLVYKLQTNAYKLSWLLIPLSLPFMWLLFPFSRRFKMYDHTVFVTYSISFMTMLAVVLSFGIGYQLWPLIVAPLLYAPFHLYRSLRGAYGLSRLGAFLRLLILSLCIWIALALFILIMISIVITG